MTRIYYDKDVNLDIIKEKRIGVVGFGNQGRAQALNMRDSGLDVVVGLRLGSASIIQAERDGFEVKDIQLIFNSVDILFILTPDECHSDIFSQISFTDNKSQTCVFAHGLSIEYKHVILPKNIDTILISPKGPGKMLRKEFTQGRSIPGLIAVHSDYSGQAFEKALALSKALGLTRAGVIETTFREEAVADMFGEQAVLCGGVTTLMKAGFEILIEKGISPEIAYFECIHELKLIVDLIYESGFENMFRAISNTAEYGAYRTYENLKKEDIKQKMELIYQDIENGNFPTQWIEENRNQLTFMKKMRELEKLHPVEKAGKTVRENLTWKE